MTLTLILTLLVNLTVTPGVTRDLSVKTICSTTWGTDSRHVTESMKKQVAAAYHVPWSKHAQYEFDHLIPRELGGADDIKNLWPQPWPDAHKKDAEENRLHKAVCAGQMTLSAAQAQMRAWGRSQ